MSTTALDKASAFLPFGSHLIIMKLVLRSTSVSITPFALAADDAVHLSVSEQLAVDQIWPHVDHLPVLDGGVSVRDLPAHVPQAVAAVFPQGAAITAVETDVGFFGVTLQ